jgi:hypothetical protein
MPKQEAVVFCRLSLQMLSGEFFFFLVVPRLADLRQLIAGGTDVLV